MDKQIPISVPEFCRCIKSHYPEDLRNISEADFGVIEDYVNVKDYPPNHILKKQNKKENVSRLILAGFGVKLAADTDGEYKYDRIYKRGEILVDLDSFKSNGASPTEIKAGPRLTVAELSREAEFRLLRDFPQLKDLSIAIRLYLSEVESSWIRILNASYQDRYEVFQEKFNSEVSHIFIKDLADLLKISERTLKRARHKQDERLRGRKSSKRKKNGKPGNDTKV